MNTEIAEYKLLLANRQPVNKYFQPMVYFLFNDDELVYIGQSKHGLTRIPEHIKSKEFTHYTWIPCPAHLLNNTEAYYILQFKPRYNSSLPGNEVYKTRKEAARVYGWTISEAREYAKNFDDIPVHELGGNEYIAIYRVGYGDAETDVWFPSIERFTNEEVNNDPYLRGGIEVVDIRRCFSWNYKE